MTLKSMTGFARGDGRLGPTKWHWEVRSVNARGLDLRMRVPPGFEVLEPPAREAIGRRFVRGAMTVTLSVHRDAAASEIRLNEPALLQVVRAAERVRDMLGSDAPRVEGLLALKGVLETVEPEEDDDAERARNGAILDTLAEALDSLTAARLSEGARLAQALEDQFAEMASLLQAVAKSPSRDPEAIRKRLADQVARLTEGPFDAARLHQEAALLATKADVEEELQRLGSHLAAAGELLRAAEPVGRKLDFLAQEFHREANTLCAKSNDLDVTRHGLALKVLIDQMREQVQNIE